MLCDDDKTPPQRRTRCGGTNTEREENEGGTALAGRGARAASLRLAVVRAAVGTAPRQANADHA